METMISNTLVLGDRGYIGSALFIGLGNEHSLTSCLLEDDYDVVDREYLSRFSTVILVAGHSSVGQCIADPRGAWENNVSKFERLLDKISPEQTFIYASSGSVYNRCENVTEENKHFYLTNIYDLTKYTIDQLAQLSGKNYYGLRFGTVCGWSPNMRWDLMINKMYKDALGGDLQINNTAVTRPILAMSDLVRAIQAIIEDPTHPGLYNLSSFTKSVGEMAEEVASTQGVGINWTDPSPAYDFNMDTTKFRETYNFNFQADLQSILTSLKNESLN